MKKWIIYSLLFFYSAIQLKPLTVIVEDILAHTFWKVHHLATEHHHHGEHHVHNELKEIKDYDHQPLSEKAPNSQKFNEDLAPHIIQEFNIQFHHSIVNTSYSKRQSTKMISVYLPISNPPPRA